MDIIARALALRRMSMVARLEPGRHMRRLKFALCLTTAFGTSVGAQGCDEESARQRAASVQHDEHDEHADPHDEHALTTLRVAPTMVRDLRLTFATSQMRPLGEAVTALGDLRVNEDAYAEVGVSLPARVNRVLASPGDRVTAGKPLAELTSIAVGAARAEVAATESRLTLARERLTRLGELAGSHIVPAQEMSAARAELHEAEVAHATAQGTVVALGATQGKGASLSLVSPIAGTVIDRNLARGRLVDAEQTLFVVGDLSRLWLIVHAFERDALRVQVGTKARVAFPALPGRGFEGTVTRIGSRVDPNSRTLDVRVEVDNPQGVLRPGMSGSASIPVGDAKSQTVTVPVVAVQRVGDLWCVFIPEAEPGHFEMRPVGRGRDLSGEVEILTGLKAGERVVVDGAFLLKAEADKARGGGDDHHH
jgi:cobalt-zinc-cadmium efflux system membrane fusion protein